MNKLNEEQAQRLVDIVQKCAESDTEFGKHEGFLEDAIRVLVRGTFPLNETFWQKRLDITTNLALLVGEPVVKDPDVICLDGFNHNTEFTIRVDITSFSLPDNVHFTVSFLNRGILPSVLPIQHILNPETYWFLHQKKLDENLEYCRNLLKKSREEVALLQSLANKYPNAIK
jgi:hypothetical protein